MVKKVVSDLGLGGSVRFGYRDAMGGTCPSEGTDTLMILCENNWDFLFMIKEFAKAGWGRHDWSGRLEPGHERPWSSVRGIEICLGQWSKQSHALGRNVLGLIWDKIDAERLKVEESGCCTRVLATGIERQGPVTKKIGAQVKRYRCLDYKELRRWCCLYRNKGV